MTKKCQESPVLNRAGADKRAMNRTPFSGLGLLAFLLWGCATTAYYSPSSRNPATITSSDSSWSKIREDGHIAMALPESVDGVPIDLSGMSGAGPWKVDGGTHRIQLAVNDLNGLFHGTFMFTLEPGKTYFFYAVRNPKVSTDRVGLGVTFLTGKRTTGTLEERPKDDPQASAFVVKQMEGTGANPTQVKAFETIIVNTYKVDG
jgi:hypothetical protein